MVLKYNKLRINGDGDSVYNRRHVGLEHEGGICHKNKTWYHWKTFLVMLAAYTNKILNITKSNRYGQEIYTLKITVNNFDNSFDSSLKKKKKSMYMHS